MRNVPVAQLVGLARASANKTKRGFAKGTVKIRGDLTEPMIPEGDWDMHKEGTP